MEQFIRAEGTGNCNLPPSSIGSVANLFAATGYVYYAKSTRSYLQEMFEFSEKFPLAYE